MEMPKPTEQDKERFRALVPDDPRVEVKPMFGNLGAFVNGNMFMGLFGSQVGLKLNDGDRNFLLSEEGAGPFGPAERPMGGYAALPPVLADDTYKAEIWVAKALDYVGALPPKVKAPKRK
jgi:TfoX/Sxy family transcriptional regulator of competence genes